MAESVTFEERRWTSNDGLALYARDYPTAVEAARLPVVCLHGLTRNSKDFEELAPRIAASGRRVIVPDVRGRGLSDRDPNAANYHPRTYARDVLALMASLEVPRAVFIGTSMGGIITMTLAAIRSSAVAAAILNDVGPAIAPEGLARILAYTGKDPGVRSWDDAVEYVRGTSAAALPSFGPDDWRRFAERTFRDRGDGPQLDYDPAISGPLRPPSRLAKLAAWLLFRRLARKRPTLLVRGALSDIVSRDIADRMKRHAPGLELAEVPGVGHAPMLDEPAAIAAIDSFLDRVP
jgi:pimeloyl-ACP methyl ester carboxylesterase